MRLVKGRHFCFHTSHLGAYTEASLPILISLSIVVLSVIALCWRWRVSIVSGLHGGSIWCHLCGINCSTRRSIAQPTLRSIDCLRKIELQATARPVLLIESVAAPTILGLNRIGEAPAAPWGHARVCKMGMRRQRKSGVGPSTPSLKKTQDDYGKSARYCY